MFDYKNSPEFLEQRLRIEHAAARLECPTSPVFVDASTPGYSEYLAILDGELVGCSVLAKSGPDGYVIQYVADESKGWSDDGKPTSWSVTEPATGRFPIAGYKLVQKHGHVVIIHCEDLAMILYAKDPSLVPFPKDKQPWQLRKEAVAEARAAQAKPSTDGDNH